MGPACDMRLPSPPLDADCKETPAKPLLVVLVDGTWRQALRMHRALDGLPHIQLTLLGTSKFHWRRQSEEGRISTVEAAASLLEELGGICDGAAVALRKSLSEL